MPLPKAKVSPPALRKKRGRLFPSLWWPFNSGPGDAAAAATAGSTDKLQGFNPTYTSAGVPPGGSMGLSGNKLYYNYDPRVGGYFRNNNFPGVFGADTSTQIQGITGPMTLAAWAYLTAASPHDGGYILGKLGINDGTTSRWNALLLIQGTDFGTAAVQFLFTVGGAFQLVTGTVAVVTKRWNFFVGTYDGATLKAYQNGRLQATAAGSGTQDTVNSLDWFTGGGQSGGTGVSLFPGYIWNAMVFPRALAGSEVSAMWYDPLQQFDPPIPIPDPGPPTPPPPTATGILHGPILVGKPATPVNPQNQTISNHSGHTPLLQ